MQPRTQFTLKILSSRGRRSLNYGNEDIKEYGLIYIGCTVHMVCWMDYKKVELKRRNVCVMSFGLQTIFSDDETKLVSSSPIA